LGIKQRSPAGARWAAKEIHQIEKMRHCEFSIVAAGVAWVKPGAKRVSGSVWWLALWPNEQNGAWQIEKADGKTSKHYESQKDNGGWDLQAVKCQGGERDQHWNGENTENPVSVDGKQCLTIVVDR
jgi:hypothetical protein